MSSKFFLVGLFTYLVLTVPIVSWIQNVKTTQAQERTLVPVYYARDVDQFEKRTIPPPVAKPQVKTKHKKINHKYRKPKKAIKKQHTVRPRTFVPFWHEYITPTPDWAKKAFWKG